MTQTMPKIVSVIGGSGFVGSQLVQELARRGYRVRVGVRRPDLAGHLRTQGTVGQIQPMQVNVRYPDSIAACVDGADMVINLSAIGVESGKQKFRAVNTSGAGNVAAIVQQAGIENFVHMSVLGAEPSSESAYLQSRALGEKEVQSAHPNATIVRASIIFGQGDEIFNRFGFLARMLPCLPLVGAETKFQPIYVGDVVEALADAAEHKVKPGKIYELGGPETVTMREIMQLVNKHANRNRPLLPIPNGLAKFMGFFAQILPNPILTVDQVNALQYDNVVSEDAIKSKRSLKAFGITPTSMESILPDYMWRFRSKGEFENVEA